MLKLVACVSGTMADQTDRMQTSREDEGEQMEIDTPAVSQLASSNGGINQEMEIGRPAVSQLASSNGGINQEMNINRDNIYNGSLFRVLIVLEKLVETQTTHSNLEILLILHVCLENSSEECQCFLGHILFPCINEDNFPMEIIQIFTRMKDSLEFILERGQEKSVKKMRSYRQFDYQLHQLFLLKCTIKYIYESIFGSYEDRLEETNENALMTTLFKITKYIDILISRHGCHYRKKWSKCSSKSRVSPSVMLPILSKFFVYYEDSASEGRFPHIFWERTTLGNKISGQESLDAILLRVNEEKCCVCLKDVLQDNFAIFSDCKHLVCIFCAEYLLIHKSESR